MSVFDIGLQIFLSMLTYKIELYEKIITVDLRSTLPRYVIIVVLSRVLEQQPLLTLVGNDGLNVG
ncbi:MAG: hypothetical protein LKJ22_06665 [Liquorilactobacillus nagelii]|jgi:hypothetical protein|uniref:hypothetical protein n=2 Tax=Liquorilactobacillus nagelii TaxID=82688 RepID=UPI002432F1F2|nr:hypothetical protein [Liquorilactobacillus nagelii]MCI1921596.1 hypothetical protein [Liquorilactobacillus nagelii]MCI1977278.1 hypothetical protein [Liquorilactobacillus nagelii]